MAQKCVKIDNILPVLNGFHHHHQPINVPTAGSKAFLMDYMWVITRPQCGLVGAYDCKCSRDQQLNVPCEARNARKHLNGFKTFYG
jgi:hypothetical protein